MDIKIDKSNKPGGWEFQVTIDQDGDESSHKVKMDENYFEKVTNGRCKPEEFVRQSFHFLLDREPKEQILSTFNIKQINRYFPEFEGEIQKRI